MNHENYLINEKESDSTNTLDVNLESLGKHIADVRKMLDCTQLIFANAIGITPQTMSLIERGKFKLTNNLASKLYFSLFEIIDDKETLAMFKLQQYQILCINDLINKLQKYISGLNSDLKDIVTEVKNIDKQ